MTRGPDIFDPNQIVEPARSDKVAYDRKVYLSAMRGDLGEGVGVGGYVAVFFVGLFLMFVITLSLGLAHPQRYGVVFGLCMSVALFVYSKRGLMNDNSLAVDLQAQAHDLEVQANALEIEHANASGAFDRWKNS